MMPKKKILVVDDDPDVLEQVTGVLTSSGYDVVTAAGPAEAEETLLSLRPDLAVLDLMMEEKDSGFILAHQIKKLYPETPVVLLTAVAGATGLSFSSPSPEARSWIKADQILDKPVRREQLEAAVRRLLRLPAADPHDSSGSD